jgi:hypothetical protein
MDWSFKSSCFFEVPIIADGHLDKSQFPEDELR